MHKPSSKKLTFQPQTLRPLDLSTVSGGRPPSQLPTCPSAVCTTNGALCVTQHHR